MDKRIDLINKMKLIKNKNSDLITEKKIIKDSITEIDKNLHQNTWWGYIASFFGY